MADDISRDVPFVYPGSIGMRLGDRFNFNRVSWGAIWAGVMVTIGMEALFLSFGIFIGALVGGSMAWSMAWYLVTMAVAFYAGAASAARLSEMPVRDVRILHGLSTWGLATLSTAIIGLVIAVSVFAKTILPYQATFDWASVTQWGGVIWGGIVLSLGSSYFGGARPLPTRSAVDQQETPATPLRRAG
jgi:hypothetical protein